MNTRFSALSALCVPAAAAGTLIAIFTDTQSGFFALRGPAALLPAVFAALLAAAAALSARGFTRSIAFGPVRRSALAGVLCAVCAVLLASGLPRLALSFVHAQQGLRLLLFAALVSTALLALWLAVTAAGFCPQQQGTAAAMWHLIPAAGCLFRLLGSFFAAPVNPRDLPLAARLITLCAAALVWVKLLGYRVQPTEQNGGRLLAAALFALYCAAGLSLPRLYAGAPLAETLCDTLCCLCGWMLAASCIASPRQNDSVSP